MAGTVLKRTGVVVLSILKGLLLAAGMFLKLVFGALKLFLMLFALIASIVLSLIRVASRS